MLLLHNSICNFPRKKWEKFVRVVAALSALVAEQEVRILGSFSLIHISLTYLVGPDQASKVNRSLKMRKLKNEQNISPKFFRTLPSMS